MRILALLLLLAPAQDTTLITIDRTGTMEEAAQALSAASGASLKVHEEVDPKAFAVRATKVGFFEALDAVCRAHGKARYFDPPKGPDEGTFEIRPGAWIDYPSVYVDDFKVVVTDLAAFTGTVTAGSTRWNRVFVTVFGPPWLRLQDDPTFKPYWTLDDARDSDGNDVQTPAGETGPPQAVDLLYYPRFNKGNVVSKVFRMKPFDPDKGLQVLKGNVQVTVAHTKEVKVPLTAGNTVDTPAGTLTVDAIGEPENAPVGKTWRVKLSLKPAKGVRTLRQAFEGRYRAEGAEFEGRVFILTFPKDGFSFDVVIRRATALPPSVQLMARDGDRRVSVPFEFKNLRF